MPTLDRDFFFDAVRRSLFRGRISVEQFFGLDAILAEADRRSLEPRWTANILAQVYHETGAAMTPVHERDNAAGTYLRNKRYYPYFGRGLIQITWKRNYEKWGIAATPEAAMEWPKALEICFDGMINGKFTGRRLREYFSPTIDDPLHARRIVNGMDKAKLIAGYHEDFLHALSA